MVAEAVYYVRNPGPFVESEYEYKYHYEPEYEPKVTQYSSLEFTESF